MSTMKLPANYASISEEEMVYLDGGASDAYNSFLNIGVQRHCPHLLRCKLHHQQCQRDLPVLPDSGRSAEELLIRLLFSSVFQELSPMWGQFFLFLTHFNRLHQKKQFFFGFGKKMHGKGIFVTLLLRILC